MKGAVLRHIGSRMLKDSDRPDQSIGGLGEFMCGLLLDMKLVLGACWSFSWGRAPCGGMVAAAGLDRTCIGCSWVPIGPLGGRRSVAMGFTEGFYACVSQR